VSVTGSDHLNSEAMSPPLLFDLAGKRIFVAGHTGMVGSAITRRLANERCEVITVSSNQLDLTRQSETEQWIQESKPDGIFLAAGRVGGIHANNSFPAEFIVNNLAIALNVISAAHSTSVCKLLYLGSSCIYPRLAPQPMTEDMLLTGPLEPTNEWYAIAKIAGIKICAAYRRQYGDDFVSVMPSNLYGPGDNYHPENSHVPAALIRRFHHAKLTRAPKVVVWGTGSPRREFMAVDDLADACVFVMKHYSDAEMINAGTGTDITIKEFAACIADVVGYDGEIAFDHTRPDGTPQKLLDVSRLRALGWRAQTSLRDGLVRAYEDFIATGGNRRG
jgi:GDP-L-fucose synthase